jgi:hypothetical protein
MFSSRAAMTSSTHRATKKAMAFWRRVTLVILGIQNAKFKMQKRNAKVAVHENRAESTSSPPHLHFAF